jgi:hypothetical protein
MKPGSIRKAGRSGRKTKDRFPSPGPRASGGRLVATGHTTCCETSAPRSSRSRGVRWLPQLLQRGFDGS